jgi:cyclopropane fatty-acyl-phospholipid synthase-like methyltransferase
MPPRSLVLAVLVAALTLVPAWIGSAASTHQDRESAAEPAAKTDERSQHGHREGHGAMHSEVDTHRPGMKHDFSDTAKHAKSFDNPERVEWQKPDQVIALMGVEEGMTVVDIGAGTGFFVPFLARAVGAGGKVLALDVEPNMVEHLRARAAESGLAQVEARRVDPGDPGVAAGSVDRILIVNTWHHIDDRGAYSAKLREGLAAGGSVWVVDFDKTSSKGPPAQHKLEPREVIAELEAGGLAAEQVAEDLPEQYVVVARAR